MLLKSILNRVHKLKSFVYGPITFGGSEETPIVEAAVRPRANSRPICSGCRRPGPSYDRQPTRRFQFPPLWGIPVFLIYAPRRVDCRHCGQVLVEEMPWADGKSRMTKAYQRFLANWARRMSFKEVADVFQTTWDNVFSAVQHAVFWGLAHRQTKGVSAIGVDEIHWGRGQYLTLVYQLDEGCKRLLWIGRERTAATLERFFDTFGQSFAAGLKFVCSDLWSGYLEVIARRAPQALHVLDRFHVMALLGKAIDEVRRAEVKRLERDGYEPILRNSRWCLLKRLENLSEKQTVKLAELMQYNLQSLRAKLSRDDFQRFWEYESVAWASKFLEDWCTRTMRSKIDPLKKAARTLRKHHELILNWFRAEGTISAGTVEGFNNKAKLTIRKAYGYRTAETLEIALFHALGSLPEPELTHRFA